MNSDSYSLSPSVSLNNTSRPITSLGNSVLVVTKEDHHDYLLQEFSKISKNNSPSLSFSEILDFLSEKQGEEFDIILCQELFARLDKTIDSTVTILEFIESYIEVESLIIKEINNSKNNLLTNNAELQKNLKKLEEAKETETMNPFGIMNDSIAKIFIKTGENLMQNYSNDLYVAVKCDEHSVETKTIKNCFKPEWKEVFSIPIYSKTQKLEFFMIQKNISSLQTIGKLSIPIKEFEDQQMHNEWYFLNSETGGKVSAKLNLEIQWIWSKVKYLKEIVTQWNKIIAEDKDKIESLKIQLNKLKRPFKENDPFDEVKINPINSITIQLDGHDIGKYAINELQSEKIEKIQKTEIFNYFAWIGFILISIIINFCRPDFLNVI